MKKLIFCVLCLFSCSKVQAVHYELTKESIDVIIPCTDKDLDLLNLCIDGIRANCSQIRRVIVISDRPLTEKAEWFDEKQFPFNKESLAYYLLKGDEQKAEKFLKSSKSRVGWYFQQLLKLYSVYIIPGISSNVLCLDSDTIFLNQVSFIDSRGKFLYNPGEEYYRPYFDHMSKLIPGLKRLFPKYSGICHHMLMQKSVLNDLFKTVESLHDMEFWRAFCFYVDEEELYDSGASEYELYFNFVFSKTDQVKLRFLKWANVTSLSEKPQYTKRGIHYISCHSHLRE